MTITPLAGFEEQPVGLLGAPYRALGNKQDPPNNRSRYG